MKKLLLCVLLFSAVAVADVKVHPECNSFGCSTVAGSGRGSTPPSTTIVRVSNLNDTGPGSLRAAFEAIGPRTIICEVSGYVDLTRKVTITSGNMSFFGATCPGAGLHVRNARLVIQASDIYISNLSWRPGDRITGEDPGSRDGITLWGSSTKPVRNVVLDQVTIANAIDELFSTYGPVHDSTVSNSLLAEPLHRSIHPKTAQDGKGHSKGGMIDTNNTNISWIGNITAHAHDRNLRLKVGVTMEALNSVFYNYGGISPWNGWNMTLGATYPGNKIIFAGNYYKAGVDTPPGLPCIYNDAGIPQTTKVYVEHNICPTRPTDNGDEWLVSALPVSMRAATPPFPGSNVPINSPTANLANLPGKVGARPWSRFSHDARVLHEVTIGTGQIRDCIENCDNNGGTGQDIQVPGGWPVLAEVHRPLTTPEDAMRVLDSGYTILENWLFGFGEDPAPLPTPAPTATVDPDATATPTPTITPTVPPTLTPTPRPSPTPLPTRTPTRTPTPRPTVTPTRTSGTAIPTPRPTVTPTPTPWVIISEPYKITIKGLPNSCSAVCLKMTPTPTPRPTL